MIDLTRRRFVFGLAAVPAVIVARKHFVMPRTDLFAPQPTIYGPWSLISVRSLLDMAHFEVTRDNGATWQPAEFRSNGLDTLTCAVGLNEMVRQRSIVTRRA